MTFDIQTRGSEPTTAVRSRLDRAPQQLVAQTLHERPDSPRHQQQLARALGWFSLGLGLTELLMPRRLAKTIGVDTSPTWLRALGLREIASGINILAQQRPGPGALQLRVAGDAIDLGFLAVAWASPRSDRARLATATAAVAGVTALDVLSSLQLSAAPTAVDPLEVSVSIPIQRSPAELYAFWRDLSNLPRVFSHVQSVQAREGGQFHVQGKGPISDALHWDVQISDNVPGEYLVWQALPGSTLNAYARLSFKTMGTDRGTLMSVTLKFEPGAEQLIKPLARLLGSAPRDGLKAELRRFKQWIETGEVATTAGQPTGRRSLLSRHLP